MKSARSFLAAILIVVAIAGVAAALNSLGTTRNSEADGIKALLGGVMLTVVLAALYVGSAVDELGRRLVPEPPKVETKQ